MAYSCVYDNEAVLYTDKDRLCDDKVLLDKLSYAGVRVAPYESIMKI